MKTPKEWVVEHMTMLGFEEEQIKNAFEAEPDHCSQSEKLFARIQADAAADIERLRAALKEISTYDEQPIWSDSRDDAADGMLTIACRALQPLPARWRCRRCGQVVKAGRCGCETSPSPWEEV